MMPVAETNHRLRMRNVITREMSPDVYRRIRGGNPKLWASNDALGNYAESELRQVWNEKRPCLKLDVTTA
jgi:hypothetical protein